MEILDLINIINEAYKKTWDELNPVLLSRDPKVCFYRGYCYEFYLIMKHYFASGQLVIEKEGMHCAILLDGGIYDVTGKRKDLHNFRKEKACDEEQIYKYYGFFSYSFRDDLYRNIFSMVSNKNKNSVKTLKKLSKYSII